MMRTSIPDYSVHPQMQRHSVAQQYVSLPEVSRSSLCCEVSKLGLHSAKKASQGAATMCNMMQHIMQPGAA